MKARRYTVRGTIARVWEAAVKGIEIKRAFLRSYRRTVDLRMGTQQDNRLIRDVHNVEVRTIVYRDSAADVSPGKEPGQSSGLLLAVSIKGKNSHQVLIELTGLEQNDVAAGDIENGPVRGKFDLGCW